MPGRVPQEGDEVVIEAGWDMIYDVFDSPILSKLEINGRLTFGDNTTMYPLTLNTHLLLVRAGIH